MDLGKYVTSIRKIKEYEEELEKQNLWWSVVAMVGKVNNHGLEPQLLDSISATQGQFDKLKKELIDQLVIRYLEKVEVDLCLQAEAFMDTLNRNLFERTADVGFLSADLTLIEYLQSQDFGQFQRQQIEKRLAAYVSKYSVYMDIAVFDKQCQLVASISNPDSNDVASDKVLHEALSKKGYIEFDRPVDLVEYDEVPLYYIHRIERQGQVLGVLCMSFKFKDELQRIRQMLTVGGESIDFALSSEKGVIYKTDNGLKDLKLSVLEDAGFDELKIAGKACFGLPVKAKGYQGYQGLDWSMMAYIPVNKAFEVEATEHGFELSQDSALFPRDLHMINLEINTALTIVILNGKISALKNDVKTFLPVLGYFQDIGSKVREVFSGSIEHIHKVALSVMKEKVLFSSKLSLEVMDRNLYERANDCRWWALNPVVKEVIASRDSLQYSKVADTLHYINRLYTVYTVIFAYDQTGEIIAVSKPEHQSLVGSSIGAEPYFKKVLSCRSTQDYCVSDFAATKLYEGGHTYVYSAPVLSESQTGQNVIGGIGVVFDAKPEFEAILQAFLPKSSSQEVVPGSFSLFMNAQGVVVSVTHNSFGIEVGGLLKDVHPDFARVHNIKGVAEIQLGDCSYLVSRQDSQGYREYKNSDGHSDGVECYVFVKS